MEIMKPIMNGLAILMVIAGGTVGFMENLVLGGLLIVLAMLFMLAANMSSILAKLNDLRQPSIAMPQSPLDMDVPMSTHKLFQKPGKPPKTKTQPEMAPTATETLPPATEITPERTQMPISIEKPKIAVELAKERKEALEAKKLANEAIAKAEKEITKEQKEEPDVPVFQCKRCLAKGVERIFPDEKRLRRHIGMSHFQDLEI